MLKKLQFLFKSLHTHQQQLLLQPVLIRKNNRSRKKASHTMHVHDFCLV